MTLRQFFERYGVSIAVVSAFALLLAVLPGNAGTTEVDSAGDTTRDADSRAGGGLDIGGDEAGLDGSEDLAVDTASGGGDDQGASGGPQTDGSATTAAPVGATAGAVSFGSGPSCRADGRQKGISAHMPPCANWVKGTSNGGATAPGVTADKIVVVRYLAQLDPGTRAILRGARLSDEAAVVKDSYDKLRRYSNLHYETYGREVVFVDYRASGPSESEEAMKADALDIATRIKPFAVIDGDPAAPVPVILGAELSDRGVPCLCLTSVSSAFYKRHPLLPSSLPAIDEYAAHAAEYIAKKLAGKGAAHAGAPLTNQPRTFGLLYVNGARGRVEPENIRARDAYRRAFARYGLSFAKEVGYNYNPGRNSQEVTNVVTQMKNAKITTIIPVWDPLYPILITKEATSQLYFPEWFMTGTGLSDTTTAGRLYDPGQWNRAFGISPLWVTWADVRKSGGYREYHHSGATRDGDQGVLINVYRARIETLFIGIHLAGPNLTPTTFMNGLYSYPETGGTAGITRRFYRPGSPTEIKDFTEVWFDADRRGDDERGDNGLGMVMKADGGRRYRPGEWTTGTSKAFVDAGAAATSDNPAGGTLDPHEADGHSHPADQRCLSC